jgi:hypothetical protein
MIIKIIQLYLSGKVLILEKFFIKIITENKIVKTAIIEAMFKLKLLVAIIALSVRTSRQGLAIIKRNNPCIGFMAARAKIQNKISNRIFETASKSISKKKEATISPTNSKVITFLLFDIFL